MDDLQSSLNAAIAHFDNGHVKEAYNVFLVTAQDSLKPLFDVKFVHYSIVSKPQNTSTILSILNTCVDHIEKIMECHSLTAKGSSSPPPPLPPKPSLVNKPVLPPKPTRASPPVPVPSVTSVMKRSLSFQAVKSASPSQPLTQHTRNYSLQNDYINHSKNSVADDEIDAGHLALAKTNNNDSLTPNHSEFIKTDHVPYIPFPPLLMTHSILQAKLDELESSLKEYQARKQEMSQQETGANINHHDQVVKDELNHAISKYTPYVAEAKQTLNRVRTLHMSAATIPNILYFQPGIVAYQITRIESAIFAAITSHALLSHSAKSPHPAIVASTDFFNYITRIIEHSILLPQEASARAQHVNHWIKIAIKCQELNNYQTLKAIVSALGTPPVERLKRTWAYIPKKSMSRLESMNELMSEHNNYGMYREHMGLVSTSVLNGKSVNLIQAEHFKKSTIPFLGTFIHDMTYLLAAVGQQKQQRSNRPTAMSVSTKTPSKDYFTSFPSQHDDSRINKLLDTIAKFQSCPPYERKPNAAQSKLIYKSQNQNRPTLSQAIHRSKTSFGRIGGAIVSFGGGGGNSSSDSASTYSGSNSNRTSASGLSSNNDGDKLGDDFDAEDQHTLATQYILMQPWVSQNTVDELSNLRELPNTNNKISTGRSSSNYNSITSNTSSLMRMSSHTPGNSTSVMTLTDSSSSRPVSLDDALYNQNRSYVFGRDSANTGPMTSSSTLEDNDDDYDIYSSSPQTMTSQDTEWKEPMYNKKDFSVNASAPTVPPRPTSENKASF